MLKIREAKKTDLRSIAEILIICFPNDFSNKKTALNWINERSNLKTFSKYHIADFNGEIAGYVYNKMLGGISGILELEQIGVHPNYHGKGIGKELILESEKFWIKYFKNKFKKKLYKIILTTSEVNDKAHNLYTRCGFKYEAKIKDLYFKSNEEIWIKKLK